MEASIPPSTANILLLIILSPSRGSSIFPGVPPPSSYSPSSVPPPSPLPSTGILAPTQPCRLRQILSTSPAPSLPENRIKTPPSQRQRRQVSSTAAATTSPTAPESPSRQGPAPNHPPLKSPALCRCTEAQITNPIFPLPLSLSPKKPPNSSASPPSPSILSAEAPNKRKEANRANLLLVSSQTTEVAQGKQQLANRKVKGLERVQ